MAGEKVAGGERFGEAVVLKRTTGARRGGRRSGRSKSQVLGGSVSGTVHLRRRQIVSLCLFCFFLLLRCSLYFSFAAFFRESRGKSFADRTASWLAFDEMSAPRNRFVSANRFYSASLDILVCYRSSVVFSSFIDDALGVTEISATVSR